LYGAFFKGFLNVGRSKVSREEIWLGLALCGPLVMNELPTSSNLILEKRDGSGRDQ
jgi:hypothetical protein